jgi:hypothetical protein
MDAANEILQGTYNTSELSPHLKLLTIAHLQREEGCNNNHQSTSVIQDADYVAKLQCWSKNTSTSPSGLHLGHHKALIVQHAYSELHQDEPDRIKWDTMQLEIRTLHLTLMNYALQRGYSFS